MHLVGWQSWLLASYILSDLPMSNAYIVDLFGTYDDNDDGWNSFQFR